MKISKALKNKIGNISDYEHRIKSEAEHFSMEAEESHKKSDKVVEEKEKVELKKQNDQKTSGSKTDSEELEISEEVKDLQT